jgi:hypothetical protein
MKVKVAFVPIPVLKRLTKSNIVHLSQEDCSICSTTMDSFPPPQSREPSGSMNSPPTAGAAAAAAAQPSIMVADSPAYHHQQMNEVDPSLITPIKLHEHQIKAKKKQLQLQLAIVNNDFKQPVKPSLREKSAVGKPLKWPPVSSAKSLPPLAGRMADLMKGEKGVFGKRNTIEFEVNQECEFLASQYMLLHIVICKCTMCHADLTSCAHFNEYPKQAHPSPSCRPAI